jgi:hypothetical protein
LQSITCICLHVGVIVTRHSVSGGELHEAVRGQTSTPQTVQMLKIGNNII